MGIGIIQDNQIIYANDAVANILGYPLEEILTWTKNYNIISIIHHEDLPRLREQRDLRRTGEFNLEPYISYRIISKSGKLKWIDQYSKNILYQGKNAELVTFMDITEKKQVENMIKKEIKKLKELDQIRKNLISNVSHELKTPLMSVCTASEYIAEVFRDKFDEEVLDLLAVIERGGKRLEKLVETLLDVSRIEYQKLELDKQKCDLSEIIRICSKEMSHLIKKRKITFNLDILNSLYLEVDKLRIEQVITNLLSNAIKNTPPKGKINII